MKRIVVSFLIVFTIVVSAQSPEMGLFIGNTYYVGDLKPYNHLSQQDFVLGGIYRNNLPNNRVAFRMNFLYGMVRGDDFKSGVEQQVKRNLSFKSSIIEIGPVIEINFFPYIQGQYQTNKEGFGTPYFFAGITYMRMNPKAKYEGEWIELQPLSTEGQGTSQNDNKPYTLSQISIPFGIGAKLNVSPRIAFSIEYGLRKTFTDYLDDVSGLYPNQTLLAQEAGVLSAELSDRSSNPEGINNTNYGLQRGNPNNKDWYSFSGIMLTFSLVKKSSCPTW
tara:strand:- start:1291 stop:2121 length:831 start_codon:yes stop_codon:yes gene_type:complete